jgi:hypothetical protein
LPPLIKPARSLGLPVHRPSVPPHRRSGGRARSGQLLALGQCAILPWDMAASSLGTVRRSSSGQGSLPRGARASVSGNAPTGRFVLSPAPVQLPNFPANHSRAGRNSGRQALAAEPGTVSWFLGDWDPCPDGVEIPVKGRSEARTESRTRFTNHMISPACGRYDRDGGWGPHLLPRAPLRPGPPPPTGRRL